ncbi:MAG: hypothetical protein ACRD0O_12875 [Acidimicrobiia bacterium]
MRRFVWCVVAGATAWAVTYAAASQLPISAATLGSGSVTPATCDSDGVSTHYVTGFDSTSGYTVTSIVVDGISSSCGGRQVSVALVDSGDNKLASGGPGAVPAGGGTVTVALSGAVAVPSVVRVHAVIS